MVLSLVTLVFVSWLSKFLFETGRLAPHYDYFRCVVNIPEDIHRMGEPSEVGEQLSVMTGAPMAKMYGAATMVGKDERNGRINPALEADDDLPVAEAKQQIHRHIQSGGGGAAIGALPSMSTGGSQGHTAF